MLRQSENRPNAKTLKERIIAGLRNSIIQGEIKPGTRLQEMEIASNYNTSRTPVREAFHQLESEGYVTIRSRRGAVVNSLTSDDVNDYYELMVMLTKLAAQNASGRIDISDREKLVKLGEKANESLAKGLSDEILQIHLETQEIITSACSNKRLSALVKSVSKQFERCRVSCDKRSWSEKLMAQLQQILGLITPGVEAKKLALANSSTANGKSVFDEHQDAHQERF